MLSRLLHVVAPVFGVAAVGWLAAGSKRFDLGTITDVVISLAAIGVAGAPALGAQPKEISCRRPCTME